MIRFYPQLVKTGVSRDGYHLDRAWMRFRRNPHHSAENHPHSLLPWPLPFADAQGHALVLVEERECWRLPPSGLGIERTCVVLQHEMASHRHSLCSIVLPVRKSDTSRPNTLVPAMFDSRTNRWCLVRLQTRVLGLVAVHDSTSHLAKGREPCLIRIG